MWKLFKTVLGYALGSLSTALLLVPISVLMLDVLILSLPVLFLVQFIVPDIFSIVFRDGLPDDFSVVNLTYTIVSVLAITGIVTDLVFPQVKQWIIKIVGTEDVLFNIWFGFFVAVVIALFLYTLPLFIETGWPYGSKEALIIILSTSGIAHLFGFQWFFMYVRLQEVATKLKSN